jgi:molecular chaperone HtpG
MAKHQFQTEINQLLQLMIHSLYSNKEIFLRELVSNASDAMDKLKFLTLTDENYKGIDFTPKVELFLDKEAKTFTIKDSGIGMNEEDLVEHLGTIAKSGTKSFLENLSGDAKKDSNLIGQFGVGFYASFMVAHKVEVISQKAGEEKAYSWTSEGNGEYEISESSREGNGTTIILHLNEEENEFLESHRIETIIQKYSNHIPFGIYLEKEVAKEQSDEDREAGKELEYETTVEQINKASALWTLPKSEISDDEYKDFYSSLSHDSSEPLKWMHNKQEGAIEYTTLFYIPSKAPFDILRVDYQPGVKLYINRVFITDDDKELLPTYLRFVKGVIDSADLPLNVSREILQSNAVLAKIKTASVKKILSELAKMATKDPENYKTFYTEFGHVLKEGLYNDFANRDKILDLLQFKHTNSDEMTTLKEYTEAMGEDQKEIYYIIGENEQTLRNSPLLEKFKAKNIDVLILDNEIDAIVFPMVTDYKETKLIPVSEAELEEKETDEEAVKANEEKFKSLTEELSKTLEEEVNSVKVSSRLDSSPVVLVKDKNDPNYAMEQMMKQMGNMDLPKSKPILEINPNHELLTKLLDNRDQNLIEDTAKLLYYQGVMANGETLDNPTDFITRMNRVLTKAL